MNCKFGKIFYSMIFYAFIHLIHWKWQCSNFFIPQDVEKVDNEVLNDIKLSCHFLWHPYMSKKPHDRMTYHFAMALYVEKSLQLYKFLKLYFFCQIISFQRIFMSKCYWKIWKLKWNFMKPLISSVSFTLVLFSNPKFKAYLHSFNDFPLYSYS